MYQLGVVPREYIPAVESWIEKMLWKSRVLAGIRWLTSKLNFTMDRLWCRFILRSSAFKGLPLLWHWKAATAILELWWLLRNYSSEEYFGRNVMGHQSAAKSWTCWVLSSWNLWSVKACDSLSNVSVFNTLRSTTQVKWHFQYMTFTATYWLLRALQKESLRKAAGNGEKAIS